jgi:glucose/arabinose dehydrogenase
MFPTARRRTVFVLSALCLALRGEAAPPPACDADSGGLKLPERFCALVVADGLGYARHLAVAENGDLYVALRNGDKEKGAIVALRDTSGDGRADVRERFGDDGGTGIRLRNGYLYYARGDRSIVRYKLRPGQLLPDPTPEVLVELPEQRSHAGKAFVFDGKGSLYVNVGAPSNACQAQDRTAQVPGQDPCPLLATSGGIWRYDEARTGQKHPAGGRRYATGLRQMIALAWHPRESALFLVQHGRDQLDTLWPALFTAEQNAELPSEELLRIAEGGDYGWPYCYHDGRQGRHVLAPEYGGDGKTLGRCERQAPPLLAFPAHWAPNDLLFYTGRQFPERYQGGAFVVFHGSWNRAPLPQGGYNVTFVPFKDGRPSGAYEPFADGFAGAAPPAAPAQAPHRPSGVAQGPDGSLYVTDSVKGRVWRVFYR